MKRVLWIPAPLAFELVGCRDDDTTGVRDVRPLLTQVSTGPVVNTTDDNTDGTCDDFHCSLREAIEFASSGAEITFALGMTGTVDHEQHRQPRRIRIETVEARRRHLRRRALGGPGREKPVHGYSSGQSA